jgi:hypothetical protein
MTLRGPLGTLGALAAGIILSAGSVTSARAALTYDFSLGTGAFVNDNLYLDPENGAADQRKPVSETMYTVSPDINLDWTGPRDALRGAYRGAYWQFTGDEELDPRWTHNLAADLRWRRWAPFFLEVQETLNLGPSAQRRNVQAVIDYTYTNNVTARTGMVWDYGARGNAELANEPMTCDTVRAMRR